MPVLRENGASFGSNATSHSASSCDAAPSKFNVISAVHTVSRIGTTRLDEQSNDGTSRWFAGGPLTKTNEHPAIATKLSPIAYCRIWSL